MSILFSQCKVSPCERNTHVVSSLLANVGENCCSISAQKDSETSLFHDFFTILKHRLGQCTRCTTVCKRTKLTRTRQTAFQKLLQSSQTSRNNKKLSKQVLVIINHILANSQINSIPEYTVFLQNFSLQNKQKFTRITSRSSRRGRRRADFIHSQREIKEIIDPEKHTFSIKSEHKST